MNTMLEKEHGIKNLVVGFKSPQFFFNETILHGLDKEIKSTITKACKKIILAQPGVRNVWTYDELKVAEFAPKSIESFYRNQLYPGRSGYLSVQVRPYCQVSEYKTGTGHRNPYESNTHVPLIIYKKGEIENKVIKDKVCMLQFANTIAQILEVPKLPASVFNILPDYFYDEQLPS